MTPHLVIREVGVGLMGLVVVKVDVLEKLEVASSHQTCITLQVA